jgi:site-specific DNA-methyltransferase (adenine-specific)
MQRLVQLLTERQDYETPPELVGSLSLEFGPFEIDFAATEANKKASRCFTPEVDALKQDWTGLVGFLNPPYGVATKAFVAKAATEKARTTCVLPARTDTRWFHAYIWDAKNHRPRPNVKTFRLLPGRVKFLIDGKPVLDPKTGKPAGGKFPSMVVVFDNLEAKRDG